jgi:hypothetical protein
MSKLFIYIVTLLLFTNVAFGSNFMNISSCNANTIITNKYTNLQINNESGICELCELVADFVEFDIKLLNSTVIEMEKSVETLCCLLGGEIIYKQCIPIIAEMQVIINLILDGLDPLKVCYIIGLC